MSLGIKDSVKSDTDEVKSEAPVPSSTETSLPISKHDRKRLKKLRKKATNAMNEGEKSGILTEVDWIELKKLMTLENSVDPSSNIGPAVRRRKGKESNKVEASHHRDLIAWFMDRICHPNGPIQQSNNKRTASSSEDPSLNPSIPSWATIHNPATISNIVILEVQVPDVINMETCQSTVDAAVLESKRRKALHLQTKLFQGYMPKSLSDGLLYFNAPPPICQKRQKVVAESDSSGNDRIVQGLEKMILPLEKWDTEGYPMAIIDENMSDETSALSAEQDSSTPSMPILESITAVDAKNFVSSSGFRVKGQNDSDKQLYLQTFVQNDPEGCEVRVFGLDCEMVLTTMGSELARITLIQLNSFHDDKLETTTILDALVKPENPVKDYLTRYSGITASALEPVTTCLQQIQVALTRILRPRDILVGHSLENDLMATHFIHPRVVDTSLIFRRDNKRTKFSLRHISASLLKRTIQKESHSSEEDALAALELAVRRASQGDTFALPSTGDRRPVLDRWNSAKNMKMACIGPQAWLQSHIINSANSIHALGCSSVAECSKAALAWTKGSRKSHLVWSHMEIVTGSENSLDAFQKMLVRI